MTVNTAIFLGAGASRAEGAPLQNELFADYFSSTSFTDNRYDEMNVELATFFELMFGINVDSEDIYNVRFPIFEEVLGLTDLAIIRKEAFKNFDIENRASNSGRLRFIAQYLVFLVALILEEKLYSSNNIHEKLVNTLESEGVIKDISFISTNYDILVDNALTKLDSRDVDLDYGIDFRNFERVGDWRRPNRDKMVSLFKPHGSLNWLYCPTCNTIEITPKEKGVVTKLISNYRESYCKECESIFMPIIVPPTFYKDLNNCFLSSIWNKAGNMLRKVNHVIFCGYSFPDADIHIKYLLKRAQINRNDTVKFTVVNHFQNKNIKNSNDEEERYKRFLGNNVNFTKMSFEDFADNPMPIINRLC